jgi:hypothetical protein
MSASLVQNTHFYPVQVTVGPGAEPGHYTVSCVPNDVTITHENAVVLYQLVQAPEGVEFWSLDISPWPQNQFRPPQVAAQGRMLILDDADLEKAAQTFQVTLRLTDPLGSQFAFDPQIINRPG